MYERAISDEPLVSSIEEKTSNDAETALTVNKSSKLIFDFSLRKKKKRKKKREKNAPALISQMDFMASTMDVERMLKAHQAESYYPPCEINLDILKSPGFVFGLNLYGQFIGKQQTQDGHIAVFGGSGTGKTSCVVKPNLFTWEGKLFVLDLKGDLIETAKRRKGVKLYLDENEPNCFYYEPFYLLRDGCEKNLASNARALSFAIIPLSPNICEPFWVEAARDVLTGCIIYFFHLGANFIETMIAIKTHRLSELFEKISADEEAKICVNADLLFSEKMVAGVSMELHNHISVFATENVVQDFLSQDDNENKGLFNWSIIEKSDIFLRVDQVHLEQWSPVIRLMITQLVSTLEKRPEKYSQAGINMSPILLMLDEFPQLGKMEVIPSALRTLRSKAVTIAIFCQSLTDLDETYGAITRRCILDNCSFKVILSAYDAESQRYFSDLIGNFPAPKLGCSANFSADGEPTGYSLNSSETRERFIQPHEFSSLKDVILLHPYNRGFCRLEKIKHFQKNFKEA